MPDSPRLNQSVKRMLILAMIFVANAIRMIVFSNYDYMMGSPFDYDPFGYGGQGEGNYTSVIKVLITRTASPSEIPIVIDDIMYVKSFYAGQHEKLRERSMIHCPTFKNAGYAAYFDPYANGTQSYPNHVLCNSENATISGNNYLSVRADFMLFARSDEYAQNISKQLDDRRIREGAPITPLHEVDVDVRDVSQNPKKIWNWLLHATEDRLAGYDYVWFIDGDVSLASLNWQAFWQQIRMLRPKITQAAVIGHSIEAHATVHNVLRYKPDPRIMAAEVPIVEVQSPLLEVDTWLNYRNKMLYNKELMDQFSRGGEQCFDMAWCHSAKNNMTGLQGHGGISYIGHISSCPKISLNDADNAGIRGSACMVLYQTPIVHVSKYTLDRYDVDLIKSAKILCEIFRLRMGVVGKEGLKTVYQFYNAPRVGPAEDIDSDLEKGNGLEKWCGGCMEGFGNCDLRLQFLKNTYGTSEIEAKVVYMKQGKCLIDT
eukprot:CAMPEP_0183744960 /NCGR_PEP_ID=MMETSP0737-20130205/65993_1 /TAXON_ID=385413 /ORGANISM="Thalassiosira miniscula, Strain CCMP1093" /LENGTH=485 /DNA_ID=CAMNT_0025980615 /DNA_START=375 /DNA_END=1832 /DNA_ORIENTATION=+